MKAEKRVEFDEARVIIADLFKQQLTSSDQLLQASTVIEQRDEGKREQKSKGQTISPLSSITKPVSPQSPDYSPVKQVSDRSIEESQAMNEKWLVCRRIHREVRHIQLEVQAKRVVHKT